MLVGKFGVGKDTVAAMIPDVIRVAFADSLKEVVRLIRQRDITKAHDVMYNLFNKKPPCGMWAKLVEFSEYPKEAGKDRILYQHLGTDWARAYDPEVWIRGLKDRIKPGNQYVITDCRFYNEFKAFPDFWTIYIDSELYNRRSRILARDGQFKEEWLQHPSETEIESLRNLCDFTVFNNASLANLELQMAHILDYCHGKKPYYQPQLIG